MGLLKPCSNLFVGGVRFNSRKVNTVGQDVLSLQITEFNGVSQQLSFALVNSASLRSRISSS